MGKVEEDNKRLLILGLGGDWYYKDQFLQDRVQRFMAKLQKIWHYGKIIQLNTIIEFSSEFTKITKRTNEIFHNQ